MSNLSWKADKGGSFATGSNWSSGAAPAATDVVNLDPTGGKAFTVTVGGAAVTVSGLEMAADATLSISGTTFDATNETGMSLAGNIIVGPGASSVFEFGGNLDAHRLAVTGGKLELNGAVGTFEGGRDITLDNATLSASAVTDVLTNGDNSVIFGAGTVTVSGVVLTNAEASSSSVKDPLILNKKADALTLDITSTASLVNDGKIWGRGGGLTIEGGVTSDGLLVTSGGTLTVTGDVTGTGAVHIIDGAVDFESAFNQDVRFHTATPGGELILGESQGYTATVFNFAPGSGEKLDLRDIGFSGATSASFASGVLTVTDGTHTAEIHLAGDYGGDTFATASDGSTGTVVTVATTAAAASPSVASLVSAMAALPSAAGGVSAGSPAGATSTSNHLALLTTHG